MKPTEKNIILSRRMIFKKKYNTGKFIEYEEVYQNQYYGTLKSEVDRIWDEGKSVIFDIDVKGARNL